MPALKHMPFQIAVAFLQLINTIFGGWADETICARCWRLRANKWWNRACKVINCIFFWQKNHCQTAYESELQRAHLSPSMRERNAG